MYSIYILFLTTIKIKTTFIKSVMGQSHSGYIKIRLYQYCNKHYRADIIYQRKEGFGQIYSSILQSDSQSFPFTKHQIASLVKSYIREY